VKATAPVAKSYLDSLKESSGIADPLEILARESNANKPASMLRVFDDLPPATAAAATARILKLRALFALNRTSDISRFFEEQSIDDGEYYLLKARYLLKQGAIDQAMQLLEKSATTGARQLETDILRRDYLYYRALCLSRLYEQSPTVANKKMALDGWFEVKNALRKYPDHSYFRKAVAEMQKIGTDASGAKG
jgi:hypothetical protein